MSENLGSVYYTVDADTTNLLEAEAVINKSLSSTVSKMSEAEKAVAAYEKQQIALGNTINKAGQVFSANGKVLAANSLEYRKLAAAASTYQTEALKQSKVAAGVSGSMANMGRNAGMAGIQLQQFIGQIQGGQSAMLALSQQGADLGFVLGAPLLGAVVGIGASLAGMLLPALMKGTDGADMLEKSLERLEQVMQQTDSGATVVSESIEKLAKISQVAAQAQLAVAWVKNKEALEAAGNAARDAFEPMQSLFKFDDIKISEAGIRSLNEYVNQFGGDAYTQFKKLTESGQGFNYGLTGVVTTMETLQGAFKISEEDAFNLIKTMNDAKSSGSGDAFASLAKQSADLAAASEKTNPILNTFAEELAKVAASALTAEDKQKQLTELMNNQGKAFGFATAETSKNNDAIASMSMAVAIANKTLAEGEEAAAKFAAMQTLSKDATAEQVQEYSRLYDMLVNYKSKIDETQAAEQAITSTTKSLSDQLAIQKAKLNDGALAAEMLATAFSMGLTSAEQLPPEIKKMVTELSKINTTTTVDRVVESLENERLQLTMTANSYEAYTLRKKLAASGASEAVIQANLAELRSLQQLRAETELMNQVDDEEQQNKVALSTSYEQTSASIQSDLETPAQKAERELAERLEVIRLYNALETAEEAAKTEMGIAAHEAYTQKIADIDADLAEKRQQTNMSTLSAMGDFFGNMASIAEAGGKDSFEAWKVMASAQAGISAALAIINTMASVPFPYNIAASAAVGALAAVQVAQISSQSYSGGKLYGGTVQAGNMYPVNENGAPELFQSGNKQYLMPNAQGKVISNKDATSSDGGNTNVNFSYAPQIQALDSEGVSAILAEQQEILWSLVNRAANERGRTL